MTATATQIKNMMCNSTGSMTFFKRTGSQYMDYTEGVMALQRECNMYWFVDLMYSHMPAVIKDFQETEETIYFVYLDVAEDKSAKFEIIRECYDYETGETVDVKVVEQDIPYADLPKIELKFYLELASYEPLVFRMLCPMEH